uniref:Uncharacterized protein n=1 Tax=Panagrolaimus sp. JU765 TaxID=591449 RepID=A0AC34R8F9_9BILA
TKAKTIMDENKLPMIEKLMYSRCASDAKTPVKLAKCVVELFLARTKYKNLEKLRRIQEYIHLNQKCTKYMEFLNEQNQNFIENENLPIDMKMKNTFDPQLEQVMKIINSVMDEKFSLLSPQIMPVLPTKKHPNLLSPTILSFNKDGFVSLPDIFHSVNAGKDEQNAWMDLLMYITGTGRKLDKVLKDLKPQIEQMKNKILPAIIKMEEMERKMKILKQTLSENQQLKMNKNGYAFLELDQMEFIHGKNHNYGKNDLAEYEHEVKLEDYIKFLSTLNEKNETNVLRRSKRQELKSNYEWMQWHALKPWAFVNRLNETVIFEAIILSPHAFFNEFLVLEVNTHDILAPRAFKITTLSPAFLMSRILSPLAFGTEVLSPRVLAALILSPMTLYTEIISPQVLEVHVGSPDALHVQVLSPNILGPRVFSPDALGVLILSPNVLSPRWISEERGLVEVCTVFTKCI